MNFSDLHFKPVAKLRFMRPGIMSSLSAALVLYDIDYFKFDKVVLMYLSAKQISVKDAET